MRALRPRSVLVALLLGITATGGATAADLRDTPLHRMPPAAPLAAAAAAGTTPETPYHYQATLVCSDCHVMHASLQHDWDGGAPPWAGAPAPRLLQKPTALELCLSCHDGRPGIPDVLNADSNGLQERVAGHFAGSGVANFTGHNLDASLQADPNALCLRCHLGGSMATAAVTCTDCHTPHGNGRWRNLQWASAPGQEPMIRAYIRPGSAGLARYERANVAYPAPAAGDGSYREVTNICIDCHHSFFAPAYTGDTSPYHRHPGTNSEWGASFPVDRAGAATDPANWVAGPPGGVGFTAARVPFIVSGATDFATASIVAASNEVFCLSCHKAHGSERAFATTWDYAGRSMAACQQCHNR